MDQVPKISIKCLCLGDVLKGQDGNKYIVCEKAKVLYWEPYVSDDVASHLGTYTVMSGDTLWKIAQKYNVCLEDILKLNPQIANPDLINVGQSINVP